MWKVLFAVVKCPDIIADQWKEELVNALKKRVNKVIEKKIAKKKWNTLYTYHV